MKIAETIKNYKASFRGDLLGGLTAAIISLPMGLAFGIQSELGAEAGLYTAVVLAIVAAIIGGTKTLISDPTGPMTVIAATVVSLGLSTHGENLSDLLPLVLMTFLMAGLIQIAFGFLNIAQYVKYISYPVVSGFMGGIGVIIITLQIFPLLGGVSPKGVFNIFAEIHQPINNLNLMALGLGLATIATIYLLPLITKKIPSILFALLGVSIVSVLFDMDVPRVGEIPTGLPALQLTHIFNFDWSDLHLILVPAVTLAALGTIDTLLTSVVADNLTKTKHNGNKELIGQGLGNAVVALFGGFPGAGATMGTVINIKTGGRSNLSGIFKGIFLMLIIVLLGSYVKFVPMAVLAGILVTIGIGIVDLKGLKLLIRKPSGDGVVLFLTLFVTIFDNLLDAVAVGAILSTMVFMKKMSDVVANMEKEGELEDFAKKSVKIPEALQHKVHVKVLDGPMFFGFADQFRDYIKAIGDDSYAVIIDMKKVPFMDETGLVTLEDGMKDILKKGIDVYIVGANSGIYQQFERAKIPNNIVSEDHFFPSFSFCVKFMKFKYNVDEIALREARNT